MDSPKRPLFEPHVFARNTNRRFADQIYQMSTYCDGVRVPAATICELPRTLDMIQRRNRKFPRMSDLVEYVHRNKIPRRTVNAMAAAAGGLDKPKRRVILPPLRPC